MQARNSRFTPPLRVGRREVWKTVGSARDCCLYLLHMQGAFYQSEFDQPHPARARAIVKAHPEVRQLMVRNPWTALIALSIVLGQTAIAYGFGRLGFNYWWL